MLKEINNLLSGAPQANIGPVRIRELSEQELLAVAGGMMADTHVHMSCCNDCHSQVRCSPAY